jgi:hypothetical protein
MLLGLMSGVYGAYSFNCFTKAYSTNKKLTPEYDNNDIDLSLFTDINNDIKDANFQARKTQSLEKARLEFYGTITDAKVQYKSKSELEKEYGAQLKLLDDLEVAETDSNLQWGIIKGEYVIYVGQFKGDKKQGKGLYINPNNIFAGEFKDDHQNGKGYTYNKNLEKLFYCTYENGQRKGRPVSVEQELEEIAKAKEKAEEEMKKEQERLKKLEEEKEALLRKQEEEKKKEGRGISFGSKESGRRKKETRRRNERSFETSGRKGFSREKKIRRRKTKGNRKRKS